MHVGLPSSAGFLTLTKHGHCDATGEEFIEVDYVKDEPKIQDGHAQVWVSASGETFQGPPAKSTASDGVTGSADTTAATVAGCEAEPIATPNPVTKEELQEMLDVLKLEKNAKINTKAKQWLAKALVCHFGDIFQHPGHRLR
jgi:hypothetical protein